MTEISAVAPWPWIERHLAVKCHKCGKVDFLDMSSTEVAEFYELHAHRDLASTIMEDAFDIDIEDPENLND